MTAKVRGRETSIIGNGSFEITLSGYTAVDGRIQFVVNGEAATSYRVESSTTLEGAWTFEENITTNVLGTSTVNDDAPLSARKFYRAVTRP